METIQPRGAGATGVGQDIQTSEIRSLVHGLLAQAYKDGRAGRRPRCILEDAQRKVPEDLGLPEVRAVWQLVSTWYDAAYQAGAQSAAQN